MYSRWVNAILIIIICCLCVHCIYLHKQLNKTVPNIEQIDSINTIIDTIYIKNDSLLRAVKESKVIITNIDEKYKNSYIRIVNGSDSANWVFFTEYLKKQEKRGLFICNNPDSIKTN